MSIMLDEANAYESSRDYDCCQIIDDAFTVGCAVNEAYCAGRDAPPADAEIEAVAKELMWWDMAPAWEDVIPPVRTISGLWQSRRCETFIS